MNKLRLISLISEKYRNKREKLFFDTFSLNQHSKLKILDLGGHPGLSCLENLHDCEVVYQNLYDSEKFINTLTKKHRYVCQDAREIPFPDSYFDIVYSNSVIEHVGNYKEQIKVAQEISRVGKKYWVQTPYKHFPIEPHYNFPFFQYLPKYMKILIYKLWPYSYRKALSREYEDIFLLDAAQIKKIFPDSTSFYFEKVGFFTKSIVAIKN